MLSFLKDHPFAVEAHFDSSIVLSFALPKDELQSLLPVHLSLDTFDDKWGFIAVAMVQTKNLRPKGFPRILGNDFFLAGYRIFVRYQDKRGKNLRGLYILKSLTDSKKMKFLGNIFTHYNYEATDISQTQQGTSIMIHSRVSGFSVAVDLADEMPALPPNSPFKDWKEARRYAGPLPFTFTFNSKKNTMLIIEGVREDWNPRPVAVNDYHFPFLKQLGFENAVLANAFIVNDIPYYWKKGKKESW